MADIKNMIFATAFVLLSSMALHAIETPDSVATKLERTQTVAKKDSTAIAPGPQQKRKPVANKNKRLRKPVARNGFDSLAVTLKSARDSVIKPVGKPLDTIVALKDTVELKQPERFSRGIEQIAFVPKGQWIGGVSVSYSQSSQDKYQFLIIENLSGDVYTFKVSPMIMFAFKNNLAAGARFAYSRSRTRLNSADFVLGSDTEYNMENLYSINHSYTGTAAFRQYMSLGGTTRFGFFNEVQVQVGGGQSKIINGVGNSLTGTYSTNLSLDVGLAPGLIVFLSNYSALEVNVGVLGFNYTKNHFITDQIYPANMRHSSANFKINLFSITFGVAFYI